MEKINLNYSTKNIPLPPRNEYMKRLIEKTEHFLRRLRWKAHFFLSVEADTPHKETYGFKSRNSPPKINELIPFEEGMLNIIHNIEFDNNASKCRFQRTLNTDIDTKIKKPNNLLVPADKTTNYYSMSTATYEKLITENVTKTYKKSSPKVVDELNSQSARVAEKRGLDKRIEKLAEREAFITLKDHKPEFHAHPTCRLINPSKSEIGIISKRILDEINTTIIQKTQINQWKNTSSVLKWFRNLDHKENLSFICFDVCDFYPSITVKLLSKALDFATTYRPISADEREIIFLSKQSLLFSNDCPWDKKIFYQQI